MKFFYMGAFGMVGIFARYFLGVFMGRFFTVPFPCATFFINLIGSFLIGVVYVLDVEKAVLNPDVRIGVMVGLLGGFTTFSAYSLETTRLIEDSQVGFAVLYFCLSPVTGILGAFGGLYLTRSLINGGAT
ncbi:fluoride efflux transporter CrcB [Candidatus Peregrinibacteria bacterium]|nr:fluoride efflux transporter CrcB [Candidatus Peregrinibacteria bacterium]